MLKLNYVSSLGVALSIYSLSYTMEVPRIKGQRQMHLQEILNNDAMRSFERFPNYSYFALPLNIDQNALSKIIQSKNKKSEDITYSTQIAQGKTVNDELKAQTNNPGEFVAPFGSASPVAVITISTYGICRHKVFMPLTDSVDLTKKALDTQLGRRFSYIEDKSKNVKEELYAQYGDQVKKNLESFKSMLYLKVLPSVAYSVAQHITKDIVTGAAEFLSYPKIPTSHPVSAQEKEKQITSIRAMKDVAIATSNLKRLKALKKNDNPQIKILEKKFESNFCQTFEKYIHTQYSSRNI